MKKKTLSLLIILLIAFTLSCSLFTPEVVTEEEAIPTETVAEPAPVEEAPARTEDGPCNNVLYPLVMGQQMVYKSTGSEGETQLGMTVSNVEGNFATIDMLNISSGIVTQSTAECEAGAIKNYPAVTMGSVLGNMLNGNLTLDYLSGYIAPAEEKFISNDWNLAWTSEYIMNGEITMEEEGETMTITIDNSPMLMNWQTLSTGESVTVPAGTYSNAIKVSRDMTMNVNLDMGLMQLDSVLTLKSTHWFEPYIGMVKMEIDEVNAEMQEMTFPITLNETMELIEVRPAE